ncbi:CopG family transcriptional regulator [Parabacteroides sp. OttesenSCG-928-N08]|nr:CopG family transcriptional regulator [Parabacteroides sp. OttesenSCG-928-N08]
MKKVIINVDWDNNYGASPANNEIAVAVTGKTFDEIKERIEFSLRRHIDDMRADGDTIPEEFTGDFELDYRMNIRALLHYTEGIVPRKALSRVTGINLQQLSHYATGWRNPKPEMQHRIVEGIHEIGKLLIDVSI